MKFKIGTILSITHDRLLCKIDDVYKILNFMLDDVLYTHQLPRAGRFAKKFIIAQNPQLEEWSILSGKINRENWQEYLQKAKRLFGNFLEIEKVTDGLWTYKEPIEELEETIDKDKIVVVKNNDNKLDDRRN